MKKFIALTILLTALSLPAFAQEQTQLGFEFTAGDTTITNRTHGVRAIGVVNLGEHVGFYGNIGVARAPFNVTDPFTGITYGQQAHDFRAGGDLRFSPFQRSGFNFFGGTGIDYHRLIQPAGGQNFSSPTLLAGAGFGKYGHAAYRHGFRDFSSPFGQRFEQGEARGFIPMGQSRWNGLLSARYRRTHLSGLPGPVDYTEVEFGVGVSRVFGVR